MTVPCHSQPSSPHGSEFAGFRFPPEVIALAVRWYLRFGLSFRDVEELLAERGIEVDHVSIYRLVRRFTPLLGQSHLFDRPDSSAPSASRSRPPVASSPGRIPDR
jgi:transposase-like protein